MEVKNITGYEGLYIIDNLGNVVSLPKQQGSRFVNEYKILGTKINRLGYKEVALSKEGKTKTYLLHRLIALHFIPNPNKYKCVNHKNGVKADNRLDNLEWCNTSHNTKHAYINNLGGFRDFANAGIKKMNEYSAYIFVKLIDNDGNEFDFPSAGEAAKFAGTTNDEITRAIRKSQRVKGYRAYGVKKTANGETLTGKADGNPVGNLVKNLEPVSTIPQKGSRADFVTARNGVLTD